MLKLDPSENTTFLNAFTSRHRHKLKRVKEKPCLECQDCHLQFTSQPLLLLHQTEVHNQANEVGVIGAEFSDDEIETTVEKKYDDLSNVYNIVDERVIEFDNVNYMEKEYQHLDKEKRIEKALAALKRLVNNI